MQDDNDGAQKFLTETLSRLSVTTSSDDAASKSDLIIEAIVEKLRIKQTLFTSLDAVYVYNAQFYHNTEIYVFVWCDELGDFYALQEIIKNLH